MGMLVNGKWHDVWYDTSSTGGRFVRADSRFRNQVTADGSSGFRAEAGRRSGCAGRRGPSPTSCKSGSPNGG